MDYRRSIRVENDDGTKTDLELNIWEPAAKDGIEGITHLVF